MQPTPYTPADLAVLVAGHDEMQAFEKKRGLDGKRVVFAGLKLRPKQSTAISRPLLSCGIFSVSQDINDLVYTHATPLKIERNDPDLGYFRVRYTGRALGQPAKRVLGYLIQRNAALILVRSAKGKGAGEVGDALVLNVREACRDIGWKGSATRDAAKFRDCLRQLKSAILELFALGSTLMTGFVAEIACIGEFDSAEVVTVNLHTAMANFFEAGATYLQVCHLAKLRDGLATWLHGYIRAHRTSKRFNIPELHAASGSTAKPKLFGTMVRDAMGKLEKAGVVLAFSASRGVLNVVLPLTANEEAAKAEKAAAKAAATTAK